MDDTRDQVFLGYAFSTPQIESAVRNAASNVADVIVAKDVILGSHILDKILRQMAQSAVCLFDLTGHNVNVALELGLAMGSKKPYRLLYNPGSTENPSGSLDFFSDLKGWDHLRYESFEDLEEKLRRALPGILANAALEQSTVPVTSSEREIKGSQFAPYFDEALSVMARTFLVPTYICRFYLAVHPQRYNPNHLRLDDLPAILDSSMVRSPDRRFPAVSPFDGGVRNLRDGIQVDANFVGVAGRYYREFYRFFQNGLFIFERVLPSDIESGGSYVTGQKTIGYRELIRSITDMASFAANLVHLYDEPCVADIRIAGLAHHALVDDTGQGVLHGPYAPPLEDDVRTSLVGSPTIFSEKSEAWATDFIKEILRLLNAPTIGTQAIKTWQA